MKAGDVEAMNAVRCGDTQDARWWLERDAETGNVDAMFNMGLINEFELGEWHGEMGKETAVYWYQKAAEAEDAESMSAMGYAYKYGEGIKLDAVEAFIWHHKAAEAGNAFSMVETGLAYAEGDGVTPDLKQALLWYRKGIDAGSNRAMLALGDAYEHGKGVVQDLEQAVDWYRKAAESGGPGLENGFAMYRLSCAYGQGKGIAKDKREALGWLWKAAEIGNGEAMLALSRAYETGDGLAKDVNKAKKWQKEAAEVGNETAIRLVWGNVPTQINERITRWRRRNDIIKLNMPIKTPETSTIGRFCDLGVIRLGEVMGAEARKALRYCPMEAGQRSAKPTGERLLPKQPWILVPPSHMRQRGGEL